MNSVFFPQFFFVLRALWTLAMILVLVWENIIIEIW